MANTNGSKEKQRAAMSQKLGRSSLSERHAGNPCICSRCAMSLELPVGVQSSHLPQKNQALSDSFEVLLKIQGRNQ